MANQNAHQASRYSLLATRYSLLATRHSPLPFHPPLARICVSLWIFLAPRAASRPICAAAERKRCRSAAAPMSFFFRMFLRTSTIRGFIEHLQRRQFQFAARRRFDIEACAGDSPPWTTARTARIIAAGASDWNMLRPMSTPWAPLSMALWAMVRASSSGSFLPPAMTIGTGQQEVTVHQAWTYLDAVDAASDRVASGTYAESVRGRDLRYAVVGRPENVSPSGLEAIRQNILTIRDPDTPADEAAALAATTPAFLYNQPAPPVLRFCFAKKDETLEKAADKLRQL